ncbi:putative phage-type endonuclease (TIGR03033) [uncultured Mediterranean phage uvMED]|nr:putative phage-type endonuclease (TIGR03033) [uncultured Mediterranean phage uvMED]
MNPMINFDKYIDVDQASEDWPPLRAGKITGSKLAVIMANYGKAFGSPAKTYAQNIAAERFSGKAISSTYQNDHMIRGHEQEPLARQEYEELEFCNVDNGGFFDCGNIGCSPDGLVGKNGIIEIKSVVASTMVTNIKRQNVDPAYRWQCIGNMLFTEADWIDFVSFCDDFPIDKKIFVYRMEAKDYLEEFKMIQSRIEDFENLISEYTELLDRGW